MIPLVPGMTGERAREWRQFARWATAKEYPVLPTDAAVVIAYLAADPHARTATQRARVGAINEAHRRTRDPRTGRPYPEPGTAEAVRQVLNPRVGDKPGRAERMADLRARVDAILPRLPADGWTAGLSGRRDAAILLLAAAGLSWRQIAALPQRDVHIDDQAVVIGTLVQRDGCDVVPVPLVELPATGDSVTCPVAVCRRWAELLAVAPPGHGHVHLERVLLGQEEPQPALLRRYAHLPFVTGFELPQGWALGAPGELDPLSPDTIAAITIRHLTAPLHITPGGDLDPTYYERGIAARARARKVGEDLDALFEQIDAMVDGI